MTRVFIQHVDLSDPRPLAVLVQAQAVQGGPAGLYQLLPGQSNTYDLTDDQIITVEVDDGP